MMYRSQFVLVTLSVLWMAGVCPAETYEVTDLGTLPGGGESRAYRLNASGWVVGWSHANIGGYVVRRPFLYDGDNLIDLGTLGGMSGEAWGINDAGDVVGTSDPSEGGYHPFIYSYGDNTMYPIEAGLGRDTGVAYAIAADIVVGHSQKAVQVSILTFYYDRAQNYARDVNTSGDVTGYSRISGYDHAYAFRDINGNGQVEDNELVNLGTFGGNTSTGYGINASGMVVGHADNASRNRHAVVWEDLDGGWDLGNGEMIDLNPVGVEESRAHGINSENDVVGFARDVGVFETWAFLYRDGTMYNLNDLVDNASGFVMTEAWDINDDGQVTGFGKNAFGATHAFLLTPIEEQIPGDANADGKVDGGDLAIWQQHYDPLGTGNNTFADGDFNGDGKIDGGDLAIWQQHYDPLGTSDRYDVSPIAEPGTLVLVVLGGALGLRRRHRR
jgi:probable HAF family extracellular repeat protein